MIAEVMDSTVGRSQNQRWRSDPFLFKSLRLAIEKLLDAFQPPGEIEPPQPPPAPKGWFADQISETGFNQWWADAHKTPETLASSAVSHVLHGFYRPSEYSEFIVALDSKKVTSPFRSPEPLEQHLTKRLRRGLVRSHYGILDAQRDLAIKPPQKKKPR
jgi:hypothetical protein